MTTNSKSAKRLQLAAGSAILVLLFVAMAGSFLFVGPLISAHNGWSSGGWRIAFATLLAFGIGVNAAKWIRVLKRPQVDGQLTTPEEYARCGAGPLPADSSATALYLDLMKRTVINLIYEDQPLSFYDDRQHPVVADRFRLDRRTKGEDLPAEAHTMVGLHRLNNLQACVEQVLREQVPGDLLEAGVLRGGASIFLRAVLKAYGETGRRAIACDTFRSRPPLPDRPIVDALLKCLSLLASLPSPGLHRRMFDLIKQIPAELRSFPATEHPSPELIALIMFMLRHPEMMKQCKTDQTGLEAVKSHFARYGLLDEQVLFLQGFFSDTLPTAPIEKLALIRLDGDLYESTRDVLVPLYPKLSSGGFCIIDDYYAFPDCRRAVDEYRSVHAITDELQRIDNLAVYWRKSAPAAVAGI